MKITAMDIEEFVAIANRINQISSPAFTMNASTGADLMRAKIASAKPRMPQVADKLLGYPIVYNEYVPSYMIGFGDLSKLDYIFDDSSKNSRMGIELISKTLFWIRIG